MRRTFLDWTRPALPAAAEVLLDAHISGSGSGRLADLARVTVVVPGARAGRRLIELLLEGAERRRTPLLPPRIVTVGVLPGLLHTPRHPLASPLVQRLVWAQALRDSPRARLGEVFARLPQPDEGLAAWRGLAREVAALAREVGAGGLRFSDVAERCSARPGGSDDGPRWQVLAAVQADLERRLERLHLADPELERLRALQENEVSLPGPIWLVGVAELPGVVARMLRAAEAPGAASVFGGVSTGEGDPSHAPLLHALIHAPASCADAFDGLGLLRVESWLPARVPLDDDDVSVVAGPGDQADAVVQLLATHAGGRRTDEVVIGVPEAEVVPALAQRLDREGIRVRDAAGTPVRQTGPWRLLAALVEVLRTRDRDAVAGLVRHPDLGPWLRDRTGAGADACLAALDRWSGRHLAARMVAPYPGVDLMGSEGDDARLVQAVMAALDDELLAGLGGHAEVGAHMAPLRAVVSTVYGLHDLDAPTATAERQRRAVQALHDVADSLVALPPELEVRCDGASALLLVLDESAGTRLADRPDAAAVELLGWLEMHLDDAPVAVVTGVNEGSLPETVRGDAFLPDALRRHLGLEHNRSRLARDLYRLTAILHSRPVVKLVAGRRTAEGDPLRPSRLLFAATDEVVARRVRRFYGMESSGATKARPVRQGEGRASAFVLPPEPVLALDPFPTTLSPTDFRAILADPYRWALRKLRGPNGATWPPLQPIDDHAVELDGAAFGDLAHLVLERFGQEELKRHRRGETAADSTAHATRLDELLDQAVRARFGPVPRVAVRLQVEQLRVRLRAFAGWHADWVGRGWRMQAAEVTTPTAGVPLGSTPPVGIRGKIDRIDHHPEHGWAVLDYKTSDRGDDPTKTHVKGGARKVNGADTEWTDLQLPLYHWLAPRLEGLPISGADPGRIAVGYVLLPRDTAATGVALADWDAATLAAGVDTARRLVAELAAGDVRYDEGLRLPYDDDPRLAALLGRSVLGGEPAEDDAADTGEGW